MTALSAPLWRDDAPLPLWRDDAPVRIGISSCLLGEAVRWDGGHKRDRFLADVLTPFVSWVPVCPEVELGMGIPREAVQLASQDGELRMLGTRSGEDWTREMQRFAARRLRQLERVGLCGYVLKSRSPSCGMQRVEVYKRNGRTRRDGRGLFASALLERNPALPVEEERRLGDPDLRAN